MSEYQYIAFRAIDAPLSDKNLEFMEQQSSRAEITRWTFDNEYHFGDFRGNTLEMLRRGYDFHLHYANFGVRKLLLRFPAGLPDASIAKQYFVDDLLYFKKDKAGEGGVLVIGPYLEPDDLEELWDVGKIVDRLVPLRAELLDGDLRPLYLARLAVSGAAMSGSDDEIAEGPVPAGLSSLTAAQSSLAEFYGLSDSLIAAAAKDSPKIGKSELADVSRQYYEWMESQPEELKNEWLAELMTATDSAIRPKLLAQFRESQAKSAWPAVHAGRTISELCKLADEITDERKRSADKEAAEKRAKRLAKMAADPVPFLRETERMVAERSSDAYRRIAELLADLRESLAGAGKSDIAEQQAKKLKAKYPTLKMLTSELRKKQFLPK